MLARAVHDVVVLDGDDLTTAADVATAAARAFRAAAPQIVQPHVLQALCLQILRARLPDVVASLLDSGAAEATLTSQMPPTIADRSPRTADGQLNLAMTRRSTVDWVLARLAAAEPGVVLRSGARVTGLVAVPGDPPRVRGVEVDGAVVPADVVVDASGRRRSLDRWLTSVGARPSRVEHAECGLAYFGRQYAVGAGAPGPVTTRKVVGLDEFTVGIWSGDNRTMQMAVAPLAVDHRFAAARDPRAFTAVLRTVPYYAAWLDALDPITDVFVMGGLHNTLRRLVVDGRTRRARDRRRGVHHEPDVRSWAQHGRADRRRPRRRLTEHSTDLNRQAALVDADAFRAVWTQMGMVGDPSRVYESPALAARVRAVLAAGTPAAAPQPARAEVEAALAIAA